MLYLRDETREAAPQCISGRTSYLQVRLAFHPYPQLIRAVFNRHRSGLPSGAYPDFNLAMGRSPGFGSTLTDSEGACAPPNALFGLGFPTAASLRGLNLPVNVTRRFILQKARRHPRSRPMGLRLLGSDGFQVLFHSPPGVLFTFPSRYWFAIGGQEYLALEGGPPGFPQGFSCPGVLGW